MTANDPPGLRPGMRRAGRPLLTGDVHLVGYLHPAALATTSAEGFRGLSKQAVDALAKSPLVPSPEVVETTLLTHEDMLAAMAAEGLEGNPTHQPFDATVLVAAYRPRPDDEVLP